MTKRKKMYIYDGLLRTKEVLAKTNETGALFCILNHYWEYYKDWQDEANKKMLNAFYSVLDSFNNRQAWKTTLTEVVSWIRKLDRLEVKVGTKKAVLKSPTSITRGDH